MHKTWSRPVVEAKLSHKKPEKGKRSEAKDIAYKVSNFIATMVQAKVYDKAMKNLNLLSLHLLFNSNNDQLP